jgi:hypothetical protein
MEEVMLVEHVLDERQSAVVEKDRDVEVKPALLQSKEAITEEKTVDILLVEDDDADAFIILEALKNIPASRMSCAPMTASKP